MPLPSFAALFYAYTLLRLLEERPLSKTVCVSVADAAACSGCHEVALALTFAFARGAACREPASASELGPQQAVLLGNNLMMSP